MTKVTNTKKIISKTNNPKVDDIRILSEMTKKDIEKSYSLENITGTEAYYSNRYGWTLRKSND
tara:strand:+ start:161 stop:349 length:189 start_codon:yes stop_codon:yes gene_type:complete